jgi:nucleolar protein 58
MVATKASLSIRVDALSDAESRSDPQAAEIGISNRVKLESRLRALEHAAGIQSTRRVTNGANGRQQPKFEMSGPGGQYNTATDSVAVDTKPQFLSTQPGSSSNAAEQRAVEAILEVKEEKREERQEERDGKKEKKDKKKRKSEAAGDVSMDVDGDASMVVGETKEERRARKEAKKAVSPDPCVSLVCTDIQAKAAKKGEAAPDTPKEKSKKRSASELDGAAEGTPVADGEKKKKKKKRESEA